MEELIKWVLQEYGLLGAVTGLFAFLFYRCTKKSDAREARLSEVVEASTKTMAVFLDRESRR